MRRREFISLLGGAVAAWPLASRAQSSDPVRRVGVLIGIAENDPVARARTEAFRQGLKELDWIDGRNVRVEFRFAGGEAARFRSLGAELVAQQPDVVLAVTTPAVEAVRQASRAIPIVFLSVVDPVRQGLVESLAHPGGNSTGFTNFEASMGGKWVEMLKMIAPDVSRVAVMFNPETSPYAELLLGSIEVARSTFSLKDVAIVPVRDANEIEAGMSGIGQGPENGLIVLPDNLTVRHRHPIIAQAARQRLPAVYPFRSFVNDGGLMVYGVDQNDTFRRAGLYVGRILKGTKPADLPVEAPTKFELVINLRTARALGLTVSPWLLAGADAVIE